MDKARRNLLIGGGAALIAAALFSAKCATSNKSAGDLKHPRGKPAPMVEEDIGPTLARLDAWYASHLPPDRYVFNPPATDGQLELVRAVGRRPGCRVPIASSTDGMMERRTTAGATSTAFRFSP